MPGVWIQTQRILGWSLSLAGPQFLPEYDEGVGQMVAKSLFICDVLMFVKNTIKKEKQDKALSVIIFQLFCVFLHQKTKCD